MSEGASNPAGSGLPATARLGTAPESLLTDAGHTHPEDNIWISAYGLTDQGRVRKNNEDNLSACDLSREDILCGPFELQRSLGPSGMLFLVADGMGGQACGEMASQMCSELLPKSLLEGFREHRNVGRSELGDLIIRALQGANGSILEASRARPECQGMGTTATAGVVYGSYLLVGQVGDSRAYLIRNRQLVQLTRDQTFLNYLLGIGAVDASTETAGDPRRSILIQAVGTADHLNVAVTGIELCQGDRFLLASDGLYSMVSTPQILSLAGNGSDVAERCRSLTAAANDAGGLDNITVILAEISGDGLPRPNSETPVEVELLSGKG
ncbi:MAG TPA: protein phosphatase 2C domain-containing protein [Terriglobia bacterium]